MDSDMTTSILKRIASGYSLPTLSPVAIRLVEIASDDSCSIDELVSLIEKDPSIAVNLLKMANSVFFRANQPVASLQQAIMRIGFHQLRIMGLSLSLRNTLPMGRVGPLDYEHFWRVSLYRGLVAKSLAYHTRSCNPEEAFVAGLILEIGFLIFFDLFVKNDKDADIPDPDVLEDLLQWEQERYGVDHRSIGEASLNYWKFPAAIVECQRFPSAQSENSEHFPLIQICDWARLFSGSMLQREAGFENLFHDAAETFGFSGDIVNDIILTTFDQVEGIAESLKLELNRERDLLQLIEKANQTLGKISETVARYEDELSRKEPPSFEMLSKIHGKLSVEYTLQAVAHEIRNPLVSVAGFAKRLARTLDPSSEGGRYVKIIVEEAERLEIALNEMTR